MRKRSASATGVLVALLLTIILFGLYRAGQVPLVPTVVATTAIPQDVQINSAWVTIRDVPETALLPTMRTSVAQVVGHYAAVPVPQGSYLVAGDIENLPLRSGLCPGEVGVTVPIANMAQAVGIYPGNYVDVVRANPGSQGQTTSAGTAAINAGQSAGAGSVATGVRVVTVENSQGGIITGPELASQQASVAGISASSTNVPALVELAVPAAEQTTFAGALSNGGVNIAPAPWTAPPTPTAICQGAGMATAGQTPPVLTVPRPPVNTAQVPGSSATSVNSTKGKRRG